MLRAACRVRETVRTGSDGFRPMPRMDVPVRHQMMREMKLKTRMGSREWEVVVLLSGMEKHRGEGCGEYGEEQRCVESGVRGLRGLRGALENLAACRDSCLEERVEKQKTSCGMN